MVGRCLPDNGTAEEHSQKHKCASGATAVEKAHTLSEHHYHMLHHEGDIFSPSPLMRLHIIAFWLSRGFRNRILQCWEVWEINHLKIFPLSLTPTRANPHPGNTFIDLTGMFCLQKVFSMQERQATGARGHPSASWGFYKDEERSSQDFFSSGQKYKNNDPFLHQAKCLSATAGLKPDFKAIGIDKSPFPTCLSIGTLGLQLKADGCTSQD